MFVTFWIFFLTTGTLMALFTLMWAIHSKQFEEQDRARYLPLVDMHPSEYVSTLPSATRADHQKRHAFWFRFGMGAVLVSCGFAILSTLVVVLKHI